MIYIVQFKYYVVCISDGLPGSFLEKTGIKYASIVVYVVTFVTIL